MLLIHSDEQLLPDIHHYMLQRVADNFVDSHIPLQLDFLQIKSHQFILFPLHHHLDPVSFTTYAEDEQQTEVDVADFVVFSWNHHNSTKNSNQIVLPSRDNRPLRP